MAVRQIRFNQDELLKKRCKEVQNIDAKTRQNLEDMMDTLHASLEGAALAANQVGILKRLVVIDYNGYCLKLVNPRIISESGVQECIEACLSFPGIVGKTTRPNQVTIQALDENGRELIISEEGEMAKCFCHELDHLDGKVFLEHVTEFVEIPSGQNS